MRKLTGWLSAGLVIVAAGTGPLSAQEPAAGATTASGTPAQALYARHCAGCHGVQGDGNGPAAAFLLPKPRNFRFGKYRLVSTENSVSSPADLEALLVRGMPGSSMPSWTHLKPEECALLYRLTVEGARERYVTNLKKEQELTDEDIKAPDVQEEIAACAKARTTPAEVATVPMIVTADRAAIARGKEHFAKQGCNSCHGNEGQGDGVEKMFDDEG